jgi:hypothetical protein
MIKTAGMSLIVVVAALAFASPAKANASCASNHLCLLPCYLAESCNAWFDSTVSPGCYPTNAGGLTHLTYSVKNRTTKNITVYHTTNCSASGGTSTLFALTNGNMNNEWAGAGIKSFRVP